MRVISNGFINCPIELSIDNHTITIINSDGYDIKPVEADSLVLYSGERFDFVLNANQPNGLYWMRFRGLLFCDKGINGVHQEAVLQYSGMLDDTYPNEIPTYLNSRRDGIVIK